MNFFNWKKRHNQILKKDEQNDNFFENLIFEEYDENSKKKELTVELLTNDFVIFSKGIKKILTLNSEQHKNPIEFDSYTQSILDSFIFQKNNLSAFLFYNHYTEQYELTDFIFKSIKLDEKVLVLTTIEDKKYIFFDYKLIKNVKDYIVYYTINSVLVSFEDHYELYASRYSTFGNLEKIISSKSINLLCKYNSDRSLLFTYVTDDNKISYIICYNYDVFINYLESKDFRFNSLNLSGNDEENIFLIATDDDNKEFLFNIYSPEITSKYYDKIKHINNLFLCKLGNYAEIIDEEFNCLYKLEINENDVTLSFDSTLNSYMIYHGDDISYSISLYSKYDDTETFYFYTVYDYQKELSTLYNKSLPFCKENFIDIVSSESNEIIFEFSDCYLVAGANYYYISKEIPFSDLSKISKNIFNDYLYSISFYDSKNQKFVTLDQKLLSILKKSNVKFLYPIKIKNEDLIIEANVGKFSNLIITNDIVELELPDDTILNLTNAEITTSLSNYLINLELDDEFVMALIKYSFS